MGNLNSAYTLERHLKSLCENNDMYSPLLSIWSVNKNRFQSVLKAIPVHYPHYSSHDMSHSNIVIDNIERLLGEERIRSLGATDTWMLLNGALLHDLGMVLEDSEIKKALESEAFSEFSEWCINISADKTLKEAAISIKEMGKNEEKVSPNNFLKAHQLRKYITLLISEFFRWQHGERSSAAIEENKFVDLSYGILPKRFLDILRKIVFCHTTNFSELYELPYQQNGFKNDVFHPRFVAVFLRLGDILDADHLRFEPAIYKSLFDILPEASKRHEQKHSSLREILITTEKIEVSFNCENFEVYREVRTWLRYLKADLNE